MFRKLIIPSAALAAATLFVGIDVMKPQSTTRGATRTGTTPAAHAVSQTSAKSSEQPVAPEPHPVGDIPDTQAFVRYSSGAGKYALDVPEGWARSVAGPNVTFIDKLDGVQVTVKPARPQNAALLRRSPILSQLGRAIRVQTVKDLHLPAGNAVFVSYTSNSDPNPVTGKQVRLENNAYFFYRQDKVATLVLWAPLGSDNVDQWNRMSRSFRWAK